MVAGELLAGDGPLGEEKEEEVVPMGSLLEARGEKEEEEEEEEEDEEEEEEEEGCGKRKMEDE